MAGAPRRWAGLLGPNNNGWGGGGQRGMTSGSLRAAQARDDSRECRRCRSSAPGPTLPSLLGGYPLPAGAKPQQDASKTGCYVKVHINAENSQCMDAMALVDTGAQICLV